MLSSRLQNVRPGFSSQTTIKLESFIAKDSMTLNFFDACSPVIQRPRNRWEKVAREVLRERAELWVRLAKL